MPLPAIIYSDCAIDSISVQADHLNSDMLLTGQTTFSGRYWTGGLTVYPHAEAQAHARADLRAGVAAVGWVAGGDAGQEAAVAASGSDDGSLDLWRFSTDSATPELQHLEGKVAHNHVVSCLDTVRGGARIATGAWDLQLRTWSVMSFLDCIATLAGHSDLVHSVCWMDEDRLLLSASQDKTVRMWDLRNNSCVHSILLQQPATAAAAEASRCLVAVGDECGSLSFYDGRKMTTHLALLREVHHDAVKAVAFPTSQESTLVASAGDDGRICIIPNGPTITAVKQQVSHLFKTEKHDSVTVRTPHGDGVYIRCLSYGSQGLYSGAWDGSIACSS